MKLSASQAAKEVGKSVPTITRALKSGKLTGEPQEGGGWLIDPAELFRVFPAVTPNDNVTPDTLGNETPIHTNALQVEIEMLRERIADKDSTIDDLRRRLDLEGEERRKLTAMLTDQRATRAAPRRSWWPFGGGNDAG